MAGVPRRGGFPGAAAALLRFVPLVFRREEGLLEDLDRAIMGGTPLVLFGQKKLDLLYLMPELTSLGQISLLLLQQGPEFHRILAGFEPHCNCT